MKTFKKINAAVIDDEQNSRDVISKIINNHFNNIEINTAKNVETGIRLINDYNPDIVFLDIDMPDGTGFDLLKKINSHHFKLIFITAYEEHAIKAIKFSALDYILKPVNATELIEAVNKAVLEIDTEANQQKITAFLSNIENLSQKPKKLVLNTSDNIYVINIEDIVRCQSENNYTTFFLNNNKKIIMSKTLKEYDNLLSENDFVRIHRSHLININYIERFDKKNTGSVFMKDNSIVPVSVRKKERLIQMLNNLL